MKRGELLTAVLAGDYGKPRPCVIVQSDSLAELDSILVCPLTTDLETHGPTRVRLNPDEQNGLKAESLIMVDKVTAISRSRCRDRIGQLEPDSLNELNRTLLIALGFAD